MSNMIAIEIHDEEFEQALKTTTKSVFHKLLLCNRLNKENIRTEVYDRLVKIVMINVAIDNNISAFADPIETERKISAHSVEVKEVEDRINNGLKVYEVTSFKDMFPTFDGCVIDIDQMELYTIETTVTN